jgi:hypothetical protein
LTLFNLAGSRRLARTWGDLVDAAGGGDTPWLTDLDHHFVAALHEELFLPSTSMIQLWDSWHLHRRTYRAILYQIVREARPRLGAGSSPAPPGRPLQVTIGLGDNRDDTLEVNPYFGPPSEIKPAPDVLTLMPFDPKMRPIYDDHILKVARGLNLVAMRADDFFCRATA